MPHVFSVGCTLTYRVHEPTAFVFNLEAASFPRQTVRFETLATQPDQGAPERFTAGESGNRYARFVVPPGPFWLDYRAEIEIDPLLHDPAAVHEIPAGDVPLDVLPHVVASRYCQSDKLSRFANRQFGWLATGHGRVTAICNWIYDSVDYISGSTDELTSAFDTVTGRAGVCRDFAHLGIALCRALGIPARYVSAYAWRLQPPDFHAVFEAYLNGPAGGAWYLFDPTRRGTVDSLVRIGVGRDAADVAFCSIFGAASSEPPTVWVTGPELDEPATILAVSTQAA